MRILLTFTFLLCWATTASPQRLDQGNTDMAAAAASGKWKEVSALAQVRTRRAPSDVVAWNFLGIAASNLGQFEQALDAFSRSAKLAPNDPLSHTNYGTALEHAGRKLEAQAEYTRSLRLNPRQPSALVDLARLEAESGDLAARRKAILHLRAAWKLAPDPEVAAFLLVIIPCEDPASSAYLALAAPAGDLPPALRLQAAKAVQTCSHWADSEHLLRPALTNPALTPSQHDAVALGLARAQIGEGHLDEAAATLSSAILVGNESPLLLTALAEVEQRRGHFDLAVPALLRAVTLTPENVDLRFRYGMLLLDARTPKAAEIRTREALEQFPTSGHLWFLLGLALFDQDETIPARAALDHALLLDPTFAAALAYRGLAAMGEQQYDMAAGFYRRAIAVEPHSSELLCLLAETIEKQHPEDPSLAYVELQHAASLDPSFARTFLIMGRIDLNRGKPELAVKELEKALSLDPTSDGTHFFLARAYRQTHQPARAEQEAALFAQLSTTGRTRERDAIRQAVRQLSQTQF